MTSNLSYPSGNTGTDPDYDVLIVGAGPTGLLLAGDLAAAGVKAVVLERRWLESNLTRAFAVHARTLEVLQMRGLAEALVGTGQRVPGLRLFGRVDVPLTQLQSAYNYVLVTPQYETEKLLLQRAHDHSALIVKNRTVTAVDQSDELVTATVRNDGQEETVTARWLVAADGANSSVRASLGVDFPGRSAVRSVMLADVRLDDDPPDVLSVNAVGEGFAFIAPFGDGYHRVIAWDRRHQRPQDAPVDLDELRAITRLALGTDFGMHSPRWMSRFRSDERQVTQYRHGRVLLAGDAAHIHSPAGGQGMNTSLQDAANLSWKLAAVVSVRADTHLLDSYHGERHPVGQQALEASDRLLQLALLEPRWKRLARDQTANLLAHVPPIRAAVARRISGIGINYPGPAPVGQRATDEDVHDTAGHPTTLHRELDGLRFAVVLPDPSAQGHTADTPDVVTLVGHPRRSSATLVRPDGHIAWQGQTSDSTAALAQRYDLQ